MLIYNSDGEHNLNLFSCDATMLWQTKAEPYTCRATHVKLTFNLTWLGVVFQFLECIFTINANKNTLSIQIDVWVVISKSENIYKYISTMVKIRDGHKISYYIFFEQSRTRIKDTKIII